jgi:hypothetical protein
MSKWLQCKYNWLKILLRQNKLTDAATVTYLNSKYATLQTLNNFVSSDVVINPGYSSANNDKQTHFLVVCRDAAGATTNTTYTFFHIFKIC